MANIIAKQATEYTLFGVTGRMHNRVLNTATGLYRNQTFTASRPFTKRGYRAGSRITVRISFDDECNNGHQSFSITGEVREPGADDISLGGCIHDDIAKHFPELATLIKWHLFDTHGPMHYVANATYHASNRDYDGLLEGEQRQIVNGRTGEKSWRLGYVDMDGNEVEKPKQYADSATEPDCLVKLVYLPWVKTGKGKERDFAAARSCAVWPEATDEQLYAPRAELEAALLARLPQMLADFRAGMDACGFDWEQTPATLEGK